MAYTYSEKTADILKVVKSDAVKGGEIVSFSFLKRKYKTVKTPIKIVLEIKYSKCNKRFARYC